jgi:UDP-GlcNAc3NAcA epimerase
VLVDHLSAMLFCPTPTAVANLTAEGVTSGVELVGDVMLDTARFFAETVAVDPIAQRFDVAKDSYYFATVHRASTSDSKERLTAVIRAFGQLEYPVLWAVHPRTMKNLEQFDLIGEVASAGNVRMLAPLSYTNTVGLLRQARALLTDSGGMQKEAYFFGVPCVTLREETEWTETVELGWNVLVGTDTEAIVAAATSSARPEERPPVYGDGHAAEAIVAAMEAHLGS